MSSDKIPHVAVIGGGPIGIEMSLNLVRSGKFKVTLLEQGPRIASHIIDHWSHVKLFSPNALNMSSLGKEIITEQGGLLPDDAAYFTGGRFVEEYLQPLAIFLQNSDECTTLFNSKVISVSRTESPKHKSFPLRAKQSFLLLYSCHDEEYFLTTDAVIDASGSYGNPNYMGPSGLPALGERVLRAQGRINYYTPSPEALTVPVTLSSCTSRMIAVVGSGASAITTINTLLDCNKAPLTILWITRTPPGQKPYEVITDDPLPQRESLYTLANSLASSEGSEHVCHSGDVTIIYKENKNIMKIEDLSSVIGESGAAQLRLTLQTCGNDITSRDHTETYDVTEVFANCGYHPDVSVTRELQVHYCYASEGPMRLAAAMIASSGGGSGDCLAQVLPGKETLRSPESRFFIIGMKSYGRGSSFLLRIGYEQVEHVMTLLEQEDF